MKSPASDGPRWSPRWPGPRRGRRVAGRAVRPVVRPARPLIACTYPAWAEGASYKVGDKVVHGGHGYEAIVAHTAHPGAGWDPASTPTLWRGLGACDGTQPPTTPPTTPAEDEVCP